MDIDLNSEKFKLFIKNNIINTINYNLSKNFKKYNFEELDENIKTNIELNKSLINYVKKINNDFTTKIEKIEKNIELLNNNINLLLLNNINNNNTKKIKEANNSNNSLNSIIDDSNLLNINLNKFNKSLNTLSNENNTLNYNIGLDLDMNDNTNQYTNQNTDNIFNTTDNYIDSISNSITNSISTSISTSITNSISNNNLIYKDLKLEDIELDIIFIKKCLHAQSLSSDLKIFKKIYIDNIPCGYYSIRNIKKKYQYWLNDKMNDDDDDGTYIKNTIVSNIYNAYLKINNYDNYADDIDQFVKNQEYILSLNEQKYKDKLFNHIIKIIQVK